MRRKNRGFLVTLDIPPGATEEDVIGYIQDAVKTWWGQLFPGSLSAHGVGPDDSDADPMFHLNPDSVSVTVPSNTRLYRRHGKFLRAGVTPPPLEE